MQNKFSHNILVVAFIALALSCVHDRKNEFPKENIDQTLLNDAGLDKLLIGAYSMMDGVADNSSTEQWDDASTNWLWGSIRGLEANKGTGADDQPDMNSIQTFSEKPDNPKINNKWRILYEGISRCNAVIAAANKALAEDKMTEAEISKYIKQARLLRGWYHFEAWRLWRYIPYDTESPSEDEITNDKDVTDKIIADLSAGIDLPNNMGQVGRFNGTVARILLGKALMQMKHDYAGALIHLNLAKTGTKPDGTAIGLAPTFGEIFDIANRNGIETIYTVQYSVNDGSGGAMAGENSSSGKYNSSSPGNCCGFFQATQDLVNSFRTVHGLPILDESYNSSENSLGYRDQGVPGGKLWSPAKKYELNEGVTVYDPKYPYVDLAYVLTNATDHIGKNPLTNPQNWTLKWKENNAKPVDPRLDWTVGRRGIPYWDWGVHTGSDWIRSEAYTGPYSNKKQVFKKSQVDKFNEVGNWTSGWTSNGYRMIRYADLLLLIAECQIETGDLADAFININLVRARAANPAGFVKESDGVTNAANYKINVYPKVWANAEEARAALRMERKLELGMEGHRFFDLNRWGITVAELNRILRYEKTTPWGKTLYGDAVVGNEDVTYPIPQKQIDLSNGRLKQRDQFAK